MLEPVLRVLSLGAGVQSSTLLLMSITGHLPRLDAAIFADTGWEPKAVYAHLDWLEMQAARVDLPVLRVSAGNIRTALLAAAHGLNSRVDTIPLYVINHGGDGTDQGGRLYRECTTAYKVVPINRACKQLLGLRTRQRVPKGTMVEQWLGISVDEFTRMKPSPQYWITRKYPLIEQRLSRQDCLDWLRRHGFPRPPKSSCIGCPYHSHAHWREMARHRPEEFADAVAFEAELQRGKLPGVTGTPYLHKRMIPLADAVEIDLKPTRNQAAFGFMDECEGVCFT